VPEPRDSVTRWVVGVLSEGDYAPDAIHLFSVLIYKSGDCVGRAMVLVYFDETVVSLLQFACSLTR
jgi:hypothetical protein